MLEGRGFSARPDVLSYAPAPSGSRVVRGRSKRPRVLSSGFARLEGRRSLLVTSYRERLSELLIAVLVEMETEKDWNHKSWSCVDDCFQ